MAQYDDPNSPSPSPAGASDRAADPDWLSRPSLAARRRNQWRQYKHMTPDFGTAASDRPAPEAAVPATPPPAREAALPSFTVKPGAPSASASVASPREPVGYTGSDRTPQRPAPVRPLQMHPHSSAVPPAPATPPARPPVRPLPSAPAPGAKPSSTSTPAQVAPLRPRLTRSSTPAASAAQSLTSGGGGSTPARSSSGRSRRFSPQRRLAKLPPPVLYLLRLAILGIGVAALAGTLLSVLSPSNVASSNGNSTAAVSPDRAPERGNRGATTIAELRPTSELTRLKAQLEQLAILTPGLTPAIYALDVDSGRYVDLEGSKAVAAASTIKVPMLVAFLQQVDAGNLALNQALVLQESQIAGGSGTMANDPVGSEYTALEVATRMIVNSDNTATNLMIEALGGPDALNQQFASWGLESTVLRNPLPDLDGTNTTSTRDLALLMALVDQGNILSSRSRDRLLSIMQRTVNRSLIAFSITDGSLVANKTGDIAMALGDMALVDTPNGNRYVLAVMVQRPNNDGRASELIRRLTETIHTEFNQPIAPVGRATPPSPAGGGETVPSTEGSTPEGEPTSGVTPDGSTTPVVVPIQPANSAPRPGAAPNPSGDAIPPG